jgi:hypothetical protein
MITNNQGEVLSPETIECQRSVAGFDLEYLQDVIDTGKGGVDHQSGQVITPEAADQAKAITMARHGAFLLDKSEVYLQSYTREQK